jgi:hypothetical protein
MMLFPERTEQRAQSGAAGDGWNTLSLIGGSFQRILDG